MAEKDNKHGGADHRNEDTQPEAADKDFTMSSTDKDCVDKGSGDSISTDKISTDKSSTDKSSTDESSTNRSPNHRSYAVESAIHKFLTDPQRSPGGRRIFEVAEHDKATEERLQREAALEASRMKPSSKYSWLNGGKPPGRR